MTTGEVHGQWTGLELTRGQKVLLTRGTAGLQVGSCHSLSEGARRLNQGVPLVPYYDVKMGRILKGNAKDAWKPGKSEWDPSPSVIPP